MKLGRRSGLILSAASAICLMTAFAGVAVASPAGGVKGDPQPELKPFKLGNLSASSAGSIAMEPNGSIVAAYDIPVGNGRTLVCVLNRGKNACTDKPVLAPLDNEDSSGSPEVFIPSANHVDVLIGMCCDDNPSGDDLLFESTNGGKSFGTPVRVGGVSISAAALVGDNIVFGGGDDGAGQVVEGVSLASPGPPATTANPVTKTAFDIGVGSYRSGALVGSDFEGVSFDTTYVSYAPSGDDFNATGSYHVVGTFPKEQLLGMSGSALLTIQNDGHTTAELRLFNGTNFSAPHAVPGSSGGGPEVFTVDQDPSGAVHVFSVRAANNPVYEMVERTTTNGGRTWGGPVNLGNATLDNSFTAALDSHGSGLVLGTGDPIAYPVLAAQGVSFKIKPSTIHKGKSATASGKGSPAATGRVVTLQVERSGKWFNVTTTHEKSGGSFSFKIKGTSAGSFRYRAVAADDAGYLLFGYSNAQSLRVSG